MQIYVLNPLISKYLAIFFLFEGIDVTPLFQMSAEPSLSY